MARPGLMRHRKFARLERLLGSKALAMGHLEILWEVSYECGDDLLGDAGDVETLGCWQGEAGKLAAALVESGFLDATPEGLRVHDLWDHAPEYVKKRRKREAERREAGAALRSVTAERRTTADSGHRTAPNGTPPAPSPAPAPTQEARRPRPLDVLSAARNDAYPALAAALAASGLDLTWSRRAEVNAAMDADAARLGADRAGAVLRDAHAADPNGSLGWFKGALHSAAAGGPKVKPVDPWTPNPALPKSPEEMERDYLASAERQAALERGELAS